MSNERKLAIINLISFIFLLGASVAFARNGNTLNDNSVMPVLMPAPYAFSIWLLIYILVGVWVLKGFTATGKDAQMYQTIGYWFALCMIFAGLTILVPVKWSPIFIIGALIKALIVYSKISKSEVSKLFRVPFSFLTGWLSVATIVNITLVLKSQGITQIAGIGEIGWTIIMLAISAVIAVIFAISQQDNIYPLVFIWAYIAIAVQNSTRGAVVQMALMMCAILVIAIVYNIYRARTDE